MMEALADEKTGEGKQGCQEDEKRGRCAIRVNGAEM